MRFSEFIGYDRHGDVREIDTTLSKGRLGTLNVCANTLAFNGPAWVGVSSMPLLYTLSGELAPLSILVAYFFPMMVIAFSLIYLVRRAPAAGGVFVFSKRYLHPGAATILGWTYVIMCFSVTAMCALVGAQYAQNLLGLDSSPATGQVVASVLLLVFMVLNLRGVEATAKVAVCLLALELTVLLGLGLAGIIDPKVPDVGILSSYLPTSLDSFWTAIGPGMLFGMWMLAQFDSSINFIEEARTPVRTIQRSFLLTLTAMLVIYSIAAIGWKMAVPASTLAGLFADSAQAIGSIARLYLPEWLLWLPVLVIITSACNCLNISLNAGVRAGYRMSREGDLPAPLERLNRRQVPARLTIIGTLCGLAMVWAKPVSELQWYYDVVSITMMISYATLLLSFIRAVFREQAFSRAVLMSALPALALLTLLYIAWTAGTQPADPAYLYHVWYCGAVIIASGAAVLLYNRLRRRAPSTRIVSP
ncbi:MULTISPECIES: APC family permease [unclassified Pseudomonas]|uniref:APC family permease n=1 Tax=unclassified Pseudomonas TaxID=196821 RepID=UPI0021C9FB5E|nr:MULTISPECIES: APC family permease [unclassified Pseudomonas]MCU1732627.1 APC family permease [Pseudomonas sp. 20P_3.2_Bac4]MCU1743977.1 APC family permease [Pseudomonas sp. 20P_3.2_Bac5]